MHQPKPVSKSFKATLERTPDRLRWVIIRVPLDVHKVWGTRGHLKIKGEISPPGQKTPRFAFRTCLFPTRTGQHIMIVNKQMQKGARVAPGMAASFRLEPDTAERTVSPAPELMRVLSQNKQLRRYYDGLNYSMRREISKWIVGGKQAETRVRRGEQMAERLMGAMEAERELPPILQIALARNPKAAKGWEIMPISHRRAHLLGIFGYRSPESRARRVAKAVEMMLEYAEKHASRVEKTKP